MKKTAGLILYLLLLFDFAEAQISGNIAPFVGAVESVNMSKASSPTCVNCSEHYMRTGRTVEIYTESGHHKGTYSVWLSKGDKYIKFNNEWIRIEGKSRFSHNGNAYVIK